MTTVTPPELTSNPGRPSSIRDSLCISTEELDELVSSCESQELTEARRWPRHAFHETIVLAPIHLATNEIAGAPTLAVGHDLSRAGVSFFHGSKLPSRCAIASLRGDDGQLRSHLLTVVWSRKCADGRYKTGARFVLPEESTDGVR